MLVSILMFTKDNPDYVDLSLKSIVLQTYEHVEVIICDTSVDDRTEKLVNEQFKPHFPSITYIRQKEDSSQVEQAQLVVRMAKGEYINFLCDGDTLYPERIESLMSYFLADTNKEIQVAFSYSATMSNQGSVTEERKKLFLQECVVDGKGIGALLVSQSSRIIGSMTSFLFRKEVVSKVGTFRNKMYPLCWEIATLFTALQHGKVAYVPRLFHYEREEKDGIENPSLQESLQAVTTTLKKVIEENELYLSVMKEEDFGIDMEKKEEIIVPKIAKIDQFMKEDISIPMKEKLMNMKRDMQKLLQKKKGRTLWK
jgi:glycosyltransferase involved in cell wall biosynthesis